MAKSKIEWTDSTWNPVIGCQKVAEGCRNCYAERMACRLAAMGQIEYQKVVTDIGVNGRWTGHALCLPERLDIPMSWRKPRRVFVDSMSDLFHEDVPSSFIFDVLRTIRECEQHTFIILTKRAKRMSEWFNHYYCTTTPYPNIWLGVSVSNQTDADNFIPWLLKTPAAKRIISVEPMLDKINLAGGLGFDYYDDDGYKVEVPSVDQVICGCESGPHARPFDVDWARSLRDQCIEVGVHFFLKQMPVDGKLTKMPFLDGKQWDQMPNA